MCGSDRIHRVGIMHGVEVEFAWSPGKAISDLGFITCLNLEKSDQSDSRKLQRHAPCAVTATYGAVKYAASGFSSQSLARCVRRSTIAGILIERYTGVSVITRNVIG